MNSLKITIGEGLTSSRYAIECLLSMVVNLTLHGELDWKPWPFGDHTLPGSVTP